MQATENFHLRNQMKNHKYPKNYMQINPQILSSMKLRKGHSEGTEPFVLVTSAC